MKKYLMKYKDVTAISLFIILYILTEKFKFSKTVNYSVTYKVYFLSFFIWLLFKVTPTKTKINSTLYNILTPFFVLVSTYICLLPFYNFYGIKDFFIVVFISYYYMGYFYITLIMFMIDIFLYLKERK